VTSPATAVAATASPPATTAPPVATAAPTATVKADPLGDRQ